MKELHLLLHGHILLIWKKRSSLFGRVSLARCATSFRAVPSCKASKNSTTKSFSSCVSGSPAVEAILVPRVPSLFHSIRATK
jgi:hypothetical protein